MKIADFLGLRWSGGDSPLIEPPVLSPVIADPTFLFPHETPDGRWHLFAHSAWGICSYTSADGSIWQYRGIIVRNAMRPFVRRVNDLFLLFYEKYRPFAMPLQILPGRRRWHSSIEQRASSDLKSWSRPRTVLRATQEWMRDSRNGESISNPCFLKIGNSYRLYFSASLSFIEDCGFCEPRYIGSAESRTVDGQYIVTEPLLIDPANDTLPGVVGAGSLKVIAMEDGYVGLQNKIYRDADNRSRSAIFLLHSSDGLSWTPTSDKALVGPGEGWRKSHVYACDCRQNEVDGLWYLYFNARDGWKISEGRERIGRMIGSPG